MAYHHGDLPNALVDAARTLMARSEKEISIREVARQVGVSANAPYRHFDNRDALLGAVAAAGYRDAARSLAGQRGPGRVAEVWQRLAEREPRLVALMTSTVAGREGREGPLHEAIGDWLGEVARAIEPDLGDDDPAAVLSAAVACWAGVHGLVGLRQAGVLATLDEWLLPDIATLARRATSG